MPDSGMPGLLLGRERLRGIRYTGKWGEVRPSCPGLWEPQESLPVLFPMRLEELPQGMLSTSAHPVAKTGDMFELV